MNLLTFAALWGGGCGLVMFTFVLVAGWSLGIPLK